MKLTTNHPQSSYGQPVLVDAKGNAYGVHDITPQGQTGAQYVEAHPRCGSVATRQAYLGLVRWAVG